MEYPEYVAYGSVYVRSAQFGRLPREIACLLDGSF